MPVDRSTALAAVRSRDARFDGRFFTAVSSTGIYCRPSCPAMTPRDDHMAFFTTAAAAQDAGYRACRRCRPDAVPGSPDWDVRADAVARAMRLIGDGVVDREGIGGVAGRLGYSVRQLQRLVSAELGTTPLALARTQRAHTARLLLETTDLPLGEVAFAAGFGSVRSFNDAVRQAYAATPGEVRHRRRARGVTPEVVDVRLPLRRPFTLAGLLGHLVATAVPGVEEWRGGAYRRTLRLPHGPAIAALTPRDDHVAARLWLADPRDLTPAIGRCRRMFDLDADPAAIDEVLSADAALAPAIAAAPGRRVPRTVDAAEFALRAVLGQQVSTAAARTTTARLVERLGEPVADPGGGLTRLFPAASAFAALDPAEVPGPRFRAETLVRLAAGLASGEIDLSPGADWGDARARLAAIPGVGPWTVELTAMRGLGDPDAFPATDLGVRRGAAALGIDRPSAAAERWRPWRSYAVQHLWAALDHPINRLEMT